MEPTQYQSSNQAPSQKKYAMSIGSAIILGISGIIIAAIIAGALIISSGVRTVREIDFEKFDGFEINVDETGEQTSVNMNSNQNEEPQNSLSAENFVQIPQQDFSFIWYPKDWVLEEGNTYKGSLMEMKIVLPGGDPLVDYISVSHPLQTSCENIVDLPGHQAGTHETCHNGFIITTNSTLPIVGEAFALIKSKLVN